MILFPDVFLKNKTELTLHHDIGVSYFETVPGKISMFDTTSGYFHDTAGVKSKR